MSTEAKKPLKVIAEASSKHRYEDFDINFEVEQQCLLCTATHKVPVHFPPVTPFWICDECKAAIEYAKHLKAREQNF